MRGEQRSAGCEVDAAPDPRFVRDVADEIGEVVLEPRHDVPGAGGQGHVHGRRHRRGEAVQLGVGAGRLVVDRRRTPGERHGLQRDSPAGRARARWWGRRSSGGPLVAAVVGGMAVAVVDGVDRVAVVDGAAWSSSDAPPRVALRQVSETRTSEREAAARGHRRILAARSGPADGSSRRSLGVPS